MKGLEINKSERQGLEDKYGLIFSSGCLCGVYVFFYCIYGVYGMCSWHECVNKRFE